MVYEFYVPRFPLGAFIESFVYYKDYSPTHSIDRFLPDGNTHTVIDLTDYPKFIYDNHTLKEIQACNRVWFSGMRTNFITIPSGRDSEMFILNFRKGRTYPFVGQPLNEFADTVVDGELAMTNKILYLRDRLMLLPTVDQKFRFAEGYLLKIFSRKLTTNPFVDYAVEQILQHPHQAVMEHITAKVGFSQKHLISIFKQHVGVAPKVFLRVMRFQKAIEDIGQKKVMNWTRIAHESGYYDQAHFINDFKEFSGFTPTGYMDAKSDFLNYVAVG